MFRKRIKMKVVFIYLVTVCATLAQPTLLGEAEDCQTNACNLADNCQCSSERSPLAAGATPQLVSITFSEAVLDDLYQNFWQPLLFDRKNPDGAPISATFFVPHEYTDYSRVRDLYVQGFEIGVNSITSNYSALYWSSATEETLTREFQGQRTIISHFANIPIEDIVGVRTPQLQLQGDVSIDAYIASGLQYDSSWTAPSDYPFFPYTLDFLSHQECRAGISCPRESHPGFWVAPIIDRREIIGGGLIADCNNLYACNVRGSAAEIAAWLERQLPTSYYNRAPITLIVPSVWFRSVNNSYEGFAKFLDNMSAREDVFFVSQKQIVDWARNPVPLDQFKTDVSERKADCVRRTCNLQRLEDGSIKYMTMCVGCPYVYPWLGNPLGDV